MTVGDDALIDELERDAMFRRSSTGNLYVKAGRRYYHVPDEAIRQRIVRERRISNWSLVATWALFLYFLRDIADYFHAPLEITLLILSSIGLVVFWISQSYIVRGLKQLKRGMGMQQGNFFKTQFNAMLRRQRPIDLLGGGLLMLCLSGYMGYLAHKNHELYQYNLAHASEFETMPIYQGEVIDATQAMKDDAIRRRDQPKVDTKVNAKTSGITLLLAIMAFSFAYLRQRLLAKEK